MTRLSAYFGVVSTSILVMLSIASLAQDTWEKEREGEIKDLEIEMTKERLLILPTANRYFEKVPPRPFEPIVPAITYEVANISFATPNHVPVIRPLRIKQEELSRTNGNYVSAGLGNFTSFMVDGSLSTKRDKKKMLGADFFWRSFGKGPVDGDHSAQSTTRIDAFGNTATEAALLAGNVTYLNRRGYFYGYLPGTDVDREVLKQVYDLFSARISLASRKKGSVSYRLDGGFGRLSDAYVTSESEWSISFDGDYRLKNDGKVTIKADMAFIQRKDSLFDQGRNLVRLMPAYTFSPFDKLKLAVGANVVITNDNFIDGSSGFKLFPHIRGEYQVTEKLSAYAEFTGNVDKVTLHTLTSENFWLDANQQIIHTERAIQVDGGFHASVGPRFSGRLGASYTTYRSPYFYTTVRDAFNPAGASAGLLVDKFELSYDLTLSQLNPYAEASYFLTDVFSTTLRIDYFNYQTDLQPEAWHRPTYRGDLRIQYNLYNKVHLQAGLVVQGGMKALDPSVGGMVRTLEAATDLNFKARYFISRELSAFIQLDNILASQYPIYFNYPARGFQGMVGASWSF